VKAEIDFSATEAKVRRFEPDGRRFTDSGRMVRFVRRAQGLALKGAGPESN
jgi:hypothetical protein